MPTARFCFLSVGWGGVGGWENVAPVYSRFSILDVSQKHLVGGGVPDRL